MKASEFYAIAKTIRKYNPFSMDLLKKRSNWIGFLLLILFLFGAMVFTPKIVNAAQAFSYTWEDDFSSTQFSSFWIRINENSSNWSLSARPGFLRIMTEANAAGSSSEREPMNQIMTTLPAGDFQATTFIEINPTEDYQFAGLRIRASSTNYIEINRASVAGNGQIDWDINQNGSFESNSIDFSGTSLYLRIIRTGDVYTGQYSADGTNWNEIGTYTADYSKALIGFVAGNNLDGVTSIPADFDFLRIETNLPLFTAEHTDSFSTTTLSNYWSWLNEDSSHWSLSQNPGYLRIITKYNSQNTNILVRAMAEKRYSIETHLFFNPTKDIQNAGLLVYLDDGHYMMLGNGFCDFASCNGNGNAIFFDYVDDNIFQGTNYATPFTNTGSVYLRLDREGDIYSGYYSLNGNDWTLVGRHYAIDNGFAPDRVGVETFDILQDAEINADFDYFTLRTEMKYLYIPLVTR